MVFYTLSLERGGNTYVCRDKPYLQLYAGVFVMMGLFCGSRICDFTCKNYLETPSILYDKHPCATHIVEESRFIEYIRDMIYS